MKKIILLFACIGFSSLSFAQLELGVDGAFNTTWLFNNNVSDQGPNLNPNASFGGSYGITGTFFLGKAIGIGAEINFNSVNQKYDGTVSSVSFNATDHLNYIQVPLMLKVKTQSGFYFELGPEFNFLSSANGDLTSSPANSLADYSGKDIKTGLSNSVMGVVFGFGGRFPITDHIGITAGLRFFGALGDATTELGETDFAADAAAGKLGVAETFAHTDQSGNYRYQKTTIATGGIQIGVFYALFKNLKEEESGK